MGRGLVVRGGTIYSFYTAIRGGESLVVEQMRLVSNNIGVDGANGPMTASVVVKDSVLSDNSQWGVAVNSGVVTGNSFTRNGTGVMAGMYGYGGSGATIANNSFVQNNTGIQKQGATPIRNKTIDSGHTGLWVS